MRLQVEVGAGGGRPCRGRRPAVRARHGTPRTHARWARRRSVTASRDHGCDGSHAQYTEDHPDGHGARLLGRRSAHQGHEPVEPGVVGEEHVEVEEIVGCERRSEGRSASSAGQLQRSSAAPADISRSTIRASRAAPRLGALGAPEAVVPCRVVVVDAHGEIVDAELHVAAHRALGSDRRHRADLPHSWPLRLSDRHAPLHLSRTLRVRRSRLRTVGTVGTAENTLPAFRRALAVGRRASSRMPGSAPMAKWCWSTRGRSRGLAPASGHQSSAAELAELGCRAWPISTRAGDRFELSLDSTTSTPRHPARVAGRGALDRLWVCSGRLSTLHRVREIDTTAHLVHSTKRSARRAGRAPCRRARAGWDRGVQHASPRVDRGLVGLFHRFGAAFAGTCRRCVTCAMLEFGIDGCTPTTSTAWSPPSPNGPTASSGYRKPRRSSGQMRTKTRPTMLEPLIGPWMRAPADLPRLSPSTK